VRLRAWMTAFAVLLSGLAVASSSPAAAGGDVARAEIGPLVAGTSSYVRGTYVWTDYVYDDRGPNTNMVAGGDAAYPPNPYPGNTADFVQVHLSSTSRGALRLGAVLQTLVTGAEALIAFGLDTDRNALTGATRLPGGGWHTNQPLGLEHLVVLPTSGRGDVRSWSSGRWITSTTFEVRVDRDANLVSATVERLRPGAAIWNVVGVAGMSDASGSWLDGAHPIQDLAFVRGEDPPLDPVVAVTFSVPQLRSPWQDEVQADLLVGKQSPTQAVAAVAFGTRRTATYKVQPGVHTFLYHSRIDLGEGVRQDPLQYAGPYQPYLVRIPSGLGRKPPAILFLHGANQNHLSTVSYFNPSGVVIQGPYDVPAVLVFPLGRDPNWSTGPAEMDMLETRRDAVARLGIDRDRIVLSGISAGGAGTFRHAARHPDLWTGAYSIVGAASFSGPVGPPLENMTNLPFRAHNGLLDPLVNAAAWQTSAEALAAAETVDYRTVLVNTSSHFPVKMGNCWYMDMLRRPRQVDPARVRFTVDPADFIVDSKAGIDLRPDGAYWVSGLEPRGTGRGTIDVVSLARADRGRTATDTAAVEENASAGRDFCGPRPGLQTGDNWIHLGRTFQRAQRQPVRNGVEIRMSGLRRAVLDLARARVSTRSDVVVRLVGDGPAALVLRGPWQGRVVVLRDGREMSHTQASNGRIVIRGDLAGAHTYTVRVR